MRHAVIAATPTDYAALFSHATQRWRRQERVESRRKIRLRRYIAAASYLPLRRQPPPPPLIMRARAEARLLRCRPLTRVHAMMRAAQF